VWDDLREQIAVGREQLRRLLDVHRPLIERCSASPPSAIELSALAAMLHSFYGGVENIFKRATLELGDVLPTGESWHKDLLDSMTKATSRRTAVLSPELKQRLKGYLEFRHFFRHSYVFVLEWDRMEALVLGCEETLRLLEKEFHRFLARDEGPAGH
jgi:hypothetical protein